MKSVAKALGLGAAALMVVAGLAGCGGSGAGKSDASVPNCEGNWILHSMDAEGETVTAEDLEELGLDLSTSFAMNLAADGVATVTVFEVPTEGEWVQDGATCVITVEGDTVNAPIVDGLLVFEEDGAKIQFQRG